MDGRIRQDTDDGKPSDGPIDPAPARDGRGARFVTHEPKDAFLEESGMPGEEPPCEIHSRVTVRPDLLASTPFPYIVVSGAPSRLSP